jgi:hypothetical protein
VGVQHPVVGITAALRNNGVLWVRSYSHFDYLADDWNEGPRRSVLSVWLRRGFLYGFFKRALNRARNLSEESASRSGCASGAEASACAKKCYEFPYNRGGDVFPRRPGGTGMRQSRDAGETVSRLIDRGRNPKTAAVGGYIVIIFSPILQIRQFAEFSSHRGTVW